MRWILLALWPFFLIVMMRLLWLVAACEWAGFAPVFSLICAMVSTFVAAAVLAADRDWWGP